MERQYGEARIFFPSAIGLKPETNTYVSTYFR